MHWACLLLPRLALDVALRHHPSPEQPLALVTGPAARRQLYAVNPAARTQGLYPGQALVAAHAIGAQFETVEYDQAATERARQLLAAWAYRYSSQVSTAFDQSIVMEIGRSRALFGEWSELRKRLSRELTELGFHHRLIAAPNPHAARALANIHDALAVDEASLPKTLDTLPVERAGLGDNAAIALRRMGLRRLREVFALPRDTLARRFDRTVLPHLDALRGLSETPLPYFQPPDVFDARIELGHEAESHMALLFPLRRLTADLSAYLGARDGGVSRFALWIEHDRQSPSTIPVGLLAPEREAAMLFELARGRLQQAELPAPATGLRLIADELPPFVPARRDLFDARPQQALPWTQLRERLRARLGDDRVHGIGVRAEHRPERAWQTTLTVPPSRARTAAEADAALPPPRPGWLLSEPVPLRDSAARILAGPERIESGWWDEADIRRDYYLVETSKGQRAWVYRPAGSEETAWMLHGWFA